MNTLLQRRGLILMICLWYMAAMSLLSVSFAHRVRLHLNMVNSVQKLRAKAHYLARAAVVVAISTLEEDRNEFDALSEPWGTIDSTPWGEWFADSFAFSPEQDSVSCRIVDEERKININLAPEAVIAGLGSIEGEQVASILDWRDQDEIPRSQGAESQWYLGQVPSYMAKDGPLDFITELLLIRGVFEADLMGEDTNSNGILDPNEDDGAASIPIDDADGVLDLGLRDLFTVHGNGRVNINTAPLPVLQAIPGLSEVVSEGIVEHRAGPDGEDGTADDEPFTSFEELERVRGMSQYELGLLSSFGTLSSNVFTICATGVVKNGAARADVTIVVERTDQGLRVLSWYEG